MLSLIIDLSAWTEYEDKLISLDKRKRKTWGIPTSFPCLVTSMYCENGSIEHRFFYIIDALKLLEARSLTKTRLAFI